MNFSRYHRNDWICSNCSGVVFGNNNKIVCICGQTKWNSKQFTENRYTWRLGDKLCNNCGEWNFKRCVSCRKCKFKLL